ncbi:MAG: DUF3592 domain-containing protein [Burkholderiales bacterium]
MALLTGEVQDADRLEVLKHASPFNSAIAFVIILAIISIFNLGSSAIFKKIQQSYAMVDWPSVQGTIISSEIKEIPRKCGKGNQDSGYVANIHYQYIFRDKAYISSHIRVDEDICTGKLWAQKDVAKYPKNSFVTVHINPVSPELAFLIAGKFSGSTKISIVFNFLNSLIFSIVIWALIRQSFTKEGASKENSLRTDNPILTQRGDASLSLSHHERKNISLITLFILFTAFIWLFHNSGGDGDNSMHYAMIIAILPILLYSSLRQHVLLRTERKKMNLSYKDYILVKSGGALGLLNDGAFIRGVGWIFLILSVFIIVLMIMLGDRGMIFIGVLIDAILLWPIAIYSLWRGTKCIRIAKNTLLQQERETRGSSE